MNKPDIQKDQPSKDPVCFLDFDGVLNSNDTFKNRKISEVESEFESYVSMIDPKAVEQMNVFVEQTNAKVICSSTWRRLHTIEELNSFLKHQGATFEITGCTPVFDESWALRGNEIKAWLDTNRHYSFDRYVIFDDDSDMLLWQKRHFFQTSFMNGGLTRPIVYDAITFLKSNG